MSHQDLTIEPANAATKGLHPSAGSWPLRDDCTTAWQSVERLDPSDQALPGRIIESKIVEPGTPDILVSASSSNSIASTASASGSGGSPKPSCRKSAKSSICGECQAIDSIVLGACQICGAEKEYEAARQCEKLKCDSCSAVDSMTEMNSGVCTCEVCASLNARKFILLHTCNGIASFGRDFSWRGRCADIRFPRQDSARYLFPSIQPSINVVRDVSLGSRDLFWSSS